MEGKTNRLLALEGLRGIAAIAVVIFHALLIFYAALMYGLGHFHAPLLNSTWEQFLYGNPLSVFISGTFAVTIFFVLSGFVLSIGFFETGDTMIVKKMAAKRYLRLMLPALASVMIAWLFITLSLSHNTDAFAITHSGWLNAMWNFTPDFFDALSQGIWGIFTTQNHYYNPVLWTMMYEFIGSFLVFAILMLFGKSPKRWIVYLALAILTYHTWYLGFVLGMLLADLYSQRKFPFQKMSTGFGVLCLIVGLLLGGYPLGETVNTFYATFTLPFLVDWQNRALYNTIGAALVIIGVLNVSVVKRFFEHPKISVLGKYTYSLYLSHKLILFTVCTGVFVLLINRFGVGFHTAAFISIAITIPFIIVAAVLYEKYIDGPSIRIAGVFANWVLDLPQKAGVTAYTEQVRFVRLKAVASKIKSVFHTSSSNKKKLK